MDADGENQRPVIEGPAVEYGNDFYPDGKRILCFSNRDDGRFNGYEFEIATRTFRKLPIDLSDAISIRLSPDGERIAYHSKRDSITINTWMADLADADPAKADLRPRVHRLPVLVSGRQGARPRGARETTSSSASFLRLSL